MIFKGISYKPNAANLSGIKLTFRGVSVGRNFNPKLYVVDKIGTPVANATIKLVNGGNTYNLSTTSDGSTSITTIPRDLVYTVTITCNGYQTVKTNFIINSSFLQQIFILQLINSVIFTAKGHAVNMEPTNPENKNYQ